jgi:RNA polymerase sigma-70 factor (ECF subfamily)
MAFTIDRTVLDRAAAGDAEALAGLATQLRPHIERQLLRYPVSDEDRRDLVQATLVQIVKRIGSFRGDSNLSTWLFRVTANEALMLMRSQRRHRARLVEGLDMADLEALPSEALTPSADEGLEAEQRSAQVRGALAELPDDYRDVVVAHYHLDLGLQEIADRFQLTESAVRSRLHRARTRLRALLEATPMASELSSAAA